MSIPDRASTNIVPIAEADSQSLFAALDHIAPRNAVVRMGEITLEDDDNPIGVASINRRYRGAEQIIVKLAAEEPLEVRVVRDPAGMVETASSEPGFNPAGFIGLLSKVHIDWEPKKPGRFNA